MILLTSLTTSIAGDEVRLVDRVIAKPGKASVLIRTLGELTRAFALALATDGADPSSHRFTGMRVLLAEDNLVNQKLATRPLQLRGAHVQVLANGAEALRVLGEADFDVVLMDCQMPELDGYEATRRLRRTPGLVRNCDIPVIALTAHALAPDRAKCLAAGMNDYLTKPIDPTRLHQALTQATLGTDRRRMQPAPVAPAVFDERAVLERTGHDAEFARELIALFITSADATMRRIADAAAQGGEHCGEVQRLAHVLKGSAATVAALVVAAGAAQVERATGELETRAAVHSLVAAFDETLDEWQRRGWTRAAAS